MSETYYIVCYGCKKFCDLQSFYLVDNLNIERPSYSYLDEITKRADDYGPWSARAIAFILAHPGHRIEIINEHQVERVESEFVGIDFPDIPEDYEGTIYGFTEEFEFDKHCLEPFIKR